jgi:oligosaccharide repeat unit polymerase
MSPSPGRYTLAGLYNLIRPGTRAGGVFSQMVSITTGYTNVFTYFRELIQDATLTGSLIVMLVLAFCGGFAYRKVAERNIAWIGVLAAFYAGALFGVSSIFDYNSMILAFVLYWAVWAMPKEKEDVEWAQQVS